MGPRRSVPRTGLRTATVGLLNGHNAQADPTTLSGKADTAWAKQSEEYAQPLRRGSGDSMYTRKAYATREAPRCGQR